MGDNQLHIIHFDKLMMWAEKNNIKIKTKSTYVEEIWPVRNLVQTELIYTSQIHV